MNIPKYPLISLFILVGLFFFASPTLAVTEFKATVKPTGGDYSTLSSAENGLDYTGTCDLTSSSYLTAGYDGAVGDPTQIIDAEAVTWDAGASSGNMIHVTTVSKSGADAFFIYVAVGTLDDNDVIDDGDGNTITVAGILGTAQITIEIDGDWTGVTDTTAVTIDGWTTDEDHYIKVYTTTAARHDGKWNEGKYRLEKTATANGDQALVIAEEYVRVFGLQIYLDGNTNNKVPGSAIYFNVSGSNAEIQAAQNILRQNRGAGDSFIVNDNSAQLPGVILKFWNNLLYGGAYYTGTPGTARLYRNHPTYVYNNTLIGPGSLGNGWQIENLTNLHYFNNIAQNFANGWTGTYPNDTYMDYNLSDIAGDAPGSHSRNAATVTFADADNDDFHLASNDAGARNYGTDLSADGNLAVTDDIDGDDRPAATGKWDIGADEAAGMIIQFLRNINFGPNINFKP